MLREPESELETTDSNTIQLVDQQDAKSVGTDEPDNHAAKKQSQVGLPVGARFSGVIHSPGALYLLFEHNLSEHNALITAQGRHT